jgi:hypothetical protein
VGELIVLLGWIRIGCTSINYALSVGIPGMDRHWNGSRWPPTHASASRE